jgi:SAM-dependent methyltransferase
MGKLISNRSLELASSIYTTRVKAAKNVLDRGLISESERSCPVCGNSSGKEFGVFGYKCKKCSCCLTAYAATIPSAEGLKSYYHEISKLNAILWERSREAEFAEKYDLINSIKENISFDLGNGFCTLELGAGDGAFVGFLNSNQVDAAGIELDHGLVTHAAKNGVHIDQGDILSCAIPPADVYLCYEIIEHLVAPGDFLKRLYFEMQPGSVLVLTTPNSDGFDNKMVSEDVENRFIASALFPPYHINAFSVKSLYHLLLNCGFYIMDVSTPGGLDVAIVNHHSDYFNTIDIAADDELLNLWQQSISISNGSGHMQFVVKKPL